MLFFQPRSQGSLLPALRRAGRREPWERGCYFSSFSLFIIILYNMHACTHVFFFKERLVIHPSSHPFIHFSTYLPFYLVYLQDMRKMRLLLWYAEKRFTDLDIFSSKITFLYDSCVSIFRIFNKLNNITWKSVLSPTSSPFSC